MNQKQVKHKAYQKKTKLNTAPEPLDQVIQKEKSILRLIKTLIKLDEEQHHLLLLTANTILLMNKLEKQCPEEKNKDCNPDCTSRHRHTQGCIHNEKKKIS